jgi:hypothetical protein
MCFLQCSDDCLMLIVEFFTSKTANACGLLRVNSEIRLRLEKMWSNFTLICEMKTDTLQNYVVRSTMLTARDMTRFRHINSWQLPFARELTLKTGYKLTDLSIRFENLKILDVTRMKSQYLRRISGLKHLKEFTVSRLILNCPYDLYFIPTQKLQRMSLELVENRNFSKDRIRVLCQFLDSCAKLELCRFLYTGGSCYRRDILGNRHIPGRELYSLLSITDVDNELRSVRILSLGNNEYLSRFVCFCKYIIYLSIVVDRAFWETWVKSNSSFFLTELSCLNLIVLEMGFTFVVSDVMKKLDFSHLPETIQCLEFYFPHSLPQLNFLTKEYLLHHTSTFDGYCYIYKITSQPYCHFNHI